MAHARFPRCCWGLTAISTERPLWAGASIREPFLCLVRPQESLPFFRFPERMGHSRADLWHKVPMGHFMEPLRRAARWAMGRCTRDRLEAWPRRSPLFRAALMAQGRREG